jgi:SAM-dependent methyltransferase
MLRQALNAARLLAFQVMHVRNRHYTCPVCRYQGPFRDIEPPTGRRQDAMCPRCGALERHRLQSLVLDRILPERDCSTLRMLHFAPEAFLAERFRSVFGNYETADLCMADVDHKVNLQHLPFASGSYDFIYASHVLEHVSNDAAALAEIRRVLSPGGIAILPVPLVAHRSVEYPEPNPNESMHVRAPGPDYFDRYRAYFAQVDLHWSYDYPEHYQVHVLEARDGFPCREHPLRTPMAGARHVDAVPVCRA